MCKSKRSHGRTWTLKMLNGSYRTSWCINWYPVFEEVQLLPQHHTGHLQTSKPNPSCPVDWRCEWEESRVCCNLWRWWGERGGLRVCCSLGWTPGSKLKADVLRVRFLSYYCSIVIYKSVWDMEISHATQDMGWVKAHCETGPSALWEGIICKLMLFLYG